MQATMMVDQDSVNVDLADIMDVVTLYKCKFCDFSCGQPTGIGQHVQQAHMLVKRTKSNSTDHVLQMLSMPANSGDGVTFVAGTQTNASELLNENHDVNTSIGEVILDPGEMEESQTELDAADRIIDSADVLREESAMDVDEEASTDSLPTNKEIFLCGQCNLGFDSIENCKNHMIRDHNIMIEENEEPEQRTPIEICPDEGNTGTEVHIPGEIIFPPNRVSVGTQVMTRKKPGRKRKVKPDIKPQISVEEEFEEEMAAVGLDGNIQLDSKFEGDENQVAAEKDSSERYSEEDIEDRSRFGRRRRRLPVRLTSLYYMGKRSPVRTPTVRHPPPMKIKAEPYKLRCPKSGCHTKFRTEPSLDLHLACHKRLETETGQREMFACPKCETTEAQWKVLRVHLWKEHTIDTDLYACDKCDFKVDTLFRLERHAQIHSEARPYVCPTCDKGFKQASQLHNHKAIHMARTADPCKWYSTKLCDICQRTFANQKSLKIHIESVHSKERRFLCPYCNHATSRKAILDLHVRTHTGEKPFKCDMCAYMTGDHNSLRRHKMRHTGEKPYRCRYCPYSAIQAISLKTHMKNKHPGFAGIFACALCQYQTVNESYFSQHVLDHKNGLVQSIKTNVVARSRDGAGTQEAVVVVPSRLPPSLTKAVVAPSQSVLRLAPPAQQQRLITLPDGRQVVAIQAPSLPSHSTANAPYPISLAKLTELGELEGGSDTAQLIYSALNALSQSGAMPGGAMVSTQQANGVMARPTVQSTTHEGVTTHTITFHIPPTEEGEEAKNGEEPQPPTAAGERTGTTEVVHVEENDGQVLLTIQPAENQQQHATVSDVTDEATEVTYTTENVAPSVLHVTDGQGGLQVLEVIQAGTDATPTEVSAYEATPTVGEEATSLEESEEAQPLEISPETEVMDSEQGEVKTVMMEVMDGDGNIQHTQYVTCTIDTAD